MKPRFVGSLNFAPMNPNRPDLWQLEEPLGQITSDGFLLISRPWKYINGASFPRIVQPILGHPFEGASKYWSPGHDQGYHGDALVLRLSDIPDMQPEFLLRRGCSSSFVYELFEVLHVEKSRKWYDRVAFEGAGIKIKGHKRTPLWERAAIWAGVRSGGWACWRKRK